MDQRAAGGLGPRAARGELRLRPTGRHGAGEAAGDHRAGGLPCALERAAGGAAGGGAAGGLPVRDYELLTVNAVVEGQSDMLACFLAQLLLQRPNLAAKKGSLIQMHLELLERVCGTLKAERSRS